MGAFSAPIGGVISACAGARKLAHSGKPYFDQQLLSSTIRDIATVELAPNAQELTEPAEPR